MSYVMFFPTAANLLQIEFYFESGYITDILPSQEKGGMIHQLQYLQMQLRA